MNYRDDEQRSMHSPEHPFARGHSLGGAAAGLRMAERHAVNLQVHLIAPPLVSWGLQRLVQAAGADLALVGCSDRLEDALPMLEFNPPDVVIIDLDDGYDEGAVARLYDRVRVKILVITGIGDPEFLNRVIAAGARGILQKREAPSALLRALETIGEGEVFANREDTGHLFMAAAYGAARAARADADPESDRIASLTLRERQTLAAVTADASVPVKVIASRLCISEHTLRNHLTSIYSKLGVPGRLALYAYANRHALTSRGGALSSRG